VHQAPLVGLGAAAALKAGEALLVEQAILHPLIHLKATMAAMDQELTDQAAGAVPGL
jgi:hypothetical protein